MTSDVLPFFEAKTGFPDRCAENTERYGNEMDYLHHHNFRMCGFVGVGEQVEPSSGHAGPASTNSPSPSSPSTAVPENFNALAG